MKRTSTTSLEGSHSNKPSDPQPKSKIEVKEQSKSQAKELKKQPIVVYTQKSQIGGDSASLQVQQKSKAANTGPRTETKEISDRDPLQKKTTKEPERVVLQNPEALKKKLKKYGQLGKRKSSIDINDVDLELKSSNQTLQKLKTKVEQEIKRNSVRLSALGIQVNSPQCCACLQFNELHSSIPGYSELVPELSRLLQFVVCKHCIQIVHYSCLSPNIAHNTIMQKQLEIEIEDADSNSLKRKVTCLVYTCDNCFSNSELKTCLACQKPQGHHIMRKLFIKGDTTTDCQYYVHHICALLLPKIYRIRDIQQFSYSVDPKYVNSSEQDDECHFCQSNAGHLLECCNNLDLKGKSSNNQPNSSKTVVHPYCALFVDNELNHPESFTIIRTLKSSDSEKQQDHLAKPLQVTALYSRNHVSYNDEQLSIYCFNERHDTIHANQAMVQCDACHQWFHNACVSEQIQARDQSKLRQLQDQQMKDAEDKDKILNTILLDKEGHFFCDICQELIHLLLGFPGFCLMQKNSSLVRDDLLSFDLRHFTRQLTGPYVGKIDKYMPSEIQLTIHSKVWLKLNKFLSSCTSTETLLKSHFLAAQYFNTNVSDQLNELRSIKDKQAQLFDLNTQDLVMPKYELKDIDILDSQFQQIISVRQANQHTVQIITPLLDKFLSAGHLSHKSEAAYIQYLRSQLMISAADATAGRCQLDQITYILEKLVKLELETTNTFKKVKLIFEEYKAWKANIESKFYQPAKTQEQLEDELKKLRSNPNKVQRIIEFFENTFSRKQGEASWLEIEAELQSNQPQIDVRDFVAETLRHAEYLRGLIERPDLPEIKPIKSLKQRLVYLSLQPFCPDPSSLIKLYERMAQWQSQAKKYIGDFKADEAVFQNLNFGMKPLSFDLLDDGDFAKDQEVQTLIQTKRYVVLELQRLCQVAIESEETDVEQLKNVVLMCNRINGDLDVPVKLVQSKLEIMDKVLAVVGDNQIDGRFEDELKEVMREVEQFKLQGIQIPEDLEMMLEAKVQIREELRSEFYATLERCADSYNKQLHLDLRKILQKATKDHNLHMETEKRIVENLSKSEEWFVQTFARLKTMTGPALHQIDFKDYQQLHAVLTSAKDCDLLLKTQNNKGSESNLVGAAKNLFRALQGAKWLFEVYSLLDRSTNYTKELSQVLQLYQKAKEFAIDFSSLQNKDEYVLSDNSTHIRGCLQNFLAIAKVAVEFDQLFGTHAKVIATLEENESDLQNLACIVDRLHQDLAQLKDNKQLPINCSQELESLLKVKKYISLNEDYQKFISEQKPELIKENQGMEIDDDSKLFLKPCLDGKISYEKALKLLCQARESQIPDDIPVLKRLNTQVQKFEKFKRQNGEYMRFRERIRIKSEQVLSQSKDEIQENDLKFTQAFVAKLLADSQLLKIELPPNSFDYEQLTGDLKHFQSWRDGANTYLRKLERDILENRDFSEDLFQDFKSQIQSICCYDSDLFLRIQAFDWILLCVNLLKGVSPKSHQETQIYNLSYWQNLYNQHTKYVDIIPAIKDNPLLQKLQYEISQTNMITEFVKNCRNTMKSLQGKYILAQRSENFDSYMALKSKHQLDKVKKMIDLSAKLHPQIGFEVQEMRTWVKQHERYTEMCANGSMWEQGIEKVKVVLRNMFTSPIDFTKIYFECDKRFKIAQEIKQDLKTMLDEHQADTRIKMSRIRQTINHFKKNCCITQIIEVEKLIRQIQQSKDILAHCEELVQNNLDQARTLYLTQIPIDLETDEIPLRREILDCTIEKLNQQISYSQFHQIEKDYLKLKQNILKCGHDYRNEAFEKLRETVHSELLSIKQGQDPTNPLVDYTQVKSDFQAFKFQKSLKRYNVKQTDDVDVNDDASKNQSINLSGSDVTMSSAESSEQQSNSQDSSMENQDVLIGEKEDIEEGGEEEISENNFSKGTASKIKEKMLSSSSSDSSDSSDSSSDSSQDIGVAAGRMRRALKPNLMPDHIYFVKPGARKEKEENLNKSQLREKREAKNAAKLFERQRQKKQMLREQQQHKEDLRPLDFNKPLTNVEDGEIISSINKMKARLRGQARNSISNALKMMSNVFGDTEKIENQRTIKDITIEIEEQIAEKHSSIDQSYSKKVADTCDNVKCLRQYTEIAELFLTKKVLQLTKITQPSINFKEQIEKMWAQRTAEKQKLTLKKPSQPVRPARQTQDVIIPPQSQQQLLPILYPSRPQQLRPQIKAIEIEERRRANSLDSVESLESNPAQFSDDENKYDPISTSLPNTKSSFLYPPPGVMQLHFNYDPHNATQFQQRSQREKILYDPIAHGANPQVTIQKTRANQAKPGSLLKIYEGSLDIQACSFSVMLFSAIDIKVFQKMPDLRKHPKLLIKGKSSLKEVCDHYTRIKHEIQQQPGSSIVLKGVCQRRSHLSGLDSENYQKFFDNMEMTQRSVVFTLIDGISLYLIPIGKSTREFCRQMNVLHLTNELYGGTNAALGQEEVCWYAWFCQVKQNYPQRSSGFWNPIVLKYAKEEVIVKDTSSKLTNSEEQRQFSPITSEEPSFESTKNVVEINLIQPAFTKVKAEQVAGEECFINQTQSQSDEIDIDQLITRLRSNIEQNDEEKIRELKNIIHKVNGTGKNVEKLEAYLKEEIAKNKGGHFQVKIEQHYLPMGLQNPMIMLPPQNLYYPQQSHRPGFGYGMQQMPTMVRPPFGNMPPTHVFTGIRPPAPMPQQYQSRPQSQQFGVMSGQMTLPPHHLQQQMQYRQMPPPGIRPPFPPQHPYQQQPPPQHPYNGSNR